MLAASTCLVMMIRNVVIAVAAPGFFRYPLASFYLTSSITIEGPGSINGAGKQSGEK
jgi:hypothetical protein